MPLTKGLVTKLDLEDWVLIKGRSFRAMPTNKTNVFYAITGTGKDTKSLHRIITQASPGEHVDHINGDRLDNRRVNLRICTHRQNRANSKIYSNNRTGYKGVGWVKDKSKFRARIKVNYKEISLGLYDSKEEAALAYNKAALKYFGKYAKLNKILA